MTTIEFNRINVTAGPEQARGWMASVSLHLLVIAGAMLIMAKIEQPVLLEPFHWDISMVEAPTQVESPPDEPVVPPPPVPVKPKPPVRPTPKPIAQQPQPVTHHESVVTNAEPVTEYTPVESTEDQVVTSQPIVAQAVTSFTEMIEQIAPFESQGPAVEHRTVEHRQVQYLRTQADYGWLRDLLWKRIEELKHYPALARSNHWEGKVVVQAVIKADGTVGALSVAESSGHALLDEEALVVMRKASPLRLTHQLEKSQITILVPISYRLEG